MLNLFIDADACPVKDEAYRVAKRNGFTVSVVANQWMNMPNDPNIRLEVVDDGFDAADNWIAEYCERGDVAMTTEDRREFAMELEKMMVGVRKSVSTR